MPDLIRRRLIVLGVCVAVFVLAYLVATFTSYPGWMWLPLFLSLIVPVAIGCVVLILLAWQLLRGIQSSR